MKEPTNLNQDPHSPPKSGVKQPRLLVLWFKEKARLPFGVDQSWRGNCLGNLIYSTLECFVGTGGEGKVEMTSKLWSQERPEVQLILLPRGWNYGFVEWSDGSTETLWIGEGNLREHVCGGNTWREEQQQGRELGLSSSPLFWEWLLLELEPVDATACIEDEKGGANTKRTLSPHLGCLFGFEWLGERAFFSQGFSPPSPSPLCLPFFSSSLFI